MTPIKAPLFANNASSNHQTHIVGKPIFINSVGNASCSLAAYGIPTIGPPVNMPIAQMSGPQSIATSVTSSVSITATYTAFNPRTKLTEVPSNEDSMDALENSDDLGLASSVPLVPTSTLNEMELELDREDNVEHLDDELDDMQNSDNNLNVNIKDMAKPRDSLSVVGEQEMVLALNEYLYDENQSEDDQEHETQHLQIDDFGGMIGAIGSSEYLASSQKKKERLSHSLWFKNGDDMESDTESESEQQYIEYLDMNHFENALGIKWATNSIYNVHHLQQVQRHLHHLQQVRLDPQHAAHHPPIAREYGQHQTMQLQQNTVSVASLIKTN